MTTAQTRRQFIEELIGDSPQLHQSVEIRDEYTLEVEGQAFDDAEGYLDDLVRFLQRERPEDLEIEDFAGGKWLLAEVRSYEQHRVIHLVWLPL